MGGCKQGWVLGACLLAACASPAEPQRAVLIISALRFESTPETAAGLNLDGVGSRGEGESCVDRGQDFVGGVDNFLARSIELFARSGVCEAAPDLSACVDREFTRSITDGTNVWVLEVEGIDDPQQDAEVVVRLHVASDAPAPDGEGGIAAGQLVDATLVEETLGSIHRGVLRASLRGPLEVTLPSAELPLVARLYDLELAIPELTPEGFERGMLGARIHTEDYPPPSDCMEACEGALERIADLDPREDDPTRCTSLSVGISMDAVRAALPSAPMR